MQTPPNTHSFMHSQSSAAVERRHSKTPPVVRRPVSKKKKMMMSWWRLPLLLLLSGDPLGTTAFSTVPSTATQAMMSRSRATAIASTVENFFEPQPQVQDDLPSISSAEESQSIQLRSVDKDALINTSIFIIAIATVVTTVLSVDVGITRGWTAEEIAVRIPLDNWRSYTNILSMAPIETKVRRSYCAKCISGWRSNS